MNKRTKVNARIEEIGYYFVGHYRTGAIRVQLETSKGHCAFDVNPMAVKDFLEAINAVEEDGQYIHELVGKNVCAWFDGEHGKILQVSDILDEQGEKAFDIHTAGGGK